MITPTKFTSLNESVLGKAPVILQALDASMSIHKLYSLVEKRFEDAGEFLYAIDVLYVLDAIQVDLVTGMVHKC
ncbi:hypothetical protein LG272_03145 [Pseudidiomarina marina]|uniref:ABC-three component system middle component 7 n=1 Tax=Pseudidiomarina marina TaxID=502366 RepID=UPI003851608E